MNIRRELYNYPYLAEQRNELQKKIDNIEENKYITLQSPVLGRIKGSSVPDQTGEAALLILTKYQDSILKLQNQIIELAEKEDLIREMLIKMGPDEHRIIELRYFKKLDWCEISKKMNYSKRQCFRMREVAISQLAKELERNL